ncbi:MAG: hypothetical protein RI979_1103, partial [Pseudomonadota bacterium]
MAAVSALSALSAAAPRAPRGTEALAMALLRDGLVRPHDLLEALRLHKARGGRLADVLLARGLVAEDQLFRILSEIWDVALFTAHSPTVDPRLIDAFGAVECIALHLLPCRVIGDRTLVATAHPEDFHRHRPRLEQVFGPVLMALAPRGVIEAALLHARGASLARLAETRVADALAADMGLDPDQRRQLRLLGEGINYNAYGDEASDQHIAPQQLYARLSGHAQPLELLRHDRIGSELDALRRASAARIT